MTTKENTTTIQAMDWPESLAAEAAVIGSMIIDSRCIEDIRDVLNIESFFHEQNRLIFDALMRIHERRDKIDGVIVRDQLEKDGTLEDVGGVEYIANVLQSVPSSANAMYYANIVAERAVLRKLLDACYGIQASVKEHDGQLDDLLDRAESLVFEATQKRIGNEAVPIRIPMVDALEAILSRTNGKMDGIMSGYAALDALTSGFHGGEMIVLAGRPSMGKTALALSMIKNMAVEDNVPCLIFTLEMSAQALCERMLSFHTGIHTQRLRTGQLDERELPVVVDAVDAFGNVKIYLDERSVVTGYDLRSMARRMMREYQVRFIVIDYLQLIRQGRGKHESRQQEIAAISSQIKGLARELDVPVLVLSQLNRLPEMREDHRPRLSDLRESGAIEQDADIVMMLHREAYYHKGDEKWLQENWQRKDMCELILAKQRNGPTGSVPLLFRSELSRFENVK